MTSVSHAGGPLPSQAALPGAALPGLLPGMGSQGLASLPLPPYPVANGGGGHPALVEAEVKVAEEEERRTRLLPARRAAALCAPPRRRWAGGIG